MIYDLIIVTGQTATGKTQLAYDLAKKYKGEIINYDSRQVYKHLDIITGKTIFPNIKTHLLDIVDPKEQFSSFDFVTLARPLISELIKKGITPILVGGTYLYLKHLLYGFDIKVPANWKLRQKLNKKSVKQLQDILKKQSVQMFEQLTHSDRNNPHRLIRRIEIALGHPRLGHSTFPERKKADYFPGKYVKKIELLNGQNNEDINFLRIGNLEKPRSYRGGVEAGLLYETKNSVSSYFKISKYIGLRFKDKEKLRKAIEKRVEQRIRNGAFQEVKHLIKHGYKLSDPGLNTIGYKQIMQYYTGSISREKTIEQWISKELQYAKRQYTFMKKDRNIDWQII